MKTIKRTSMLPEVMTAVVLIVLLAMAFYAKADGVQTRTGAKIHRAGTNGMTRCGYVVARGSTNAVDCKFCLSTNTIRFRKQ